MINITEMLERSAEKYPESIAFLDPERSITFKKLRDQSRKAATVFLQKTDGIFESAAFYMEKCTNAMTAMFGAVYAGGFYSFVDVRQPADRAIKVFLTLRPSVVITDGKNADGLKEIQAQDPEIAGIPVFDIDRLIEDLADISLDEALLLSVQSRFYDLMPLYVNFTSGSTGTPKGVVVSHRSVIDFITEFTSVFDIGHEDILANQAPFDFDVSVKDIYSGLMQGAEVVLIPRPYFKDPTTLMDYLDDNKVTTLIWAVSAMCFVSIMNGLEYKTPGTIKKIMFSGEIMPVKQLNKWMKSLPDAMYVNLYGPTEITCNCTYHILDREYEKDEIIPIGIPFRNEKVFLLDDEDRLITGPDTEGEICVCGTCLALGYYRDPERTDAVFTQNPLNVSYDEKMYRTGDLGKYDSDGILIYTTRKDFQIKHMGQRIELGEIEAAAMSVDGVERACCLYDRKKKRITLIYSGNVDKENVTEKLHEKLPPYMIPGKTVGPMELPLNKNGKIDRKALEEYI
ncbi:MAG: amino acid adenylation domain-containing protein [Lachnospiraceae bacterium]|nr:amino acid adenylation domain-containing protein [Lachnospiraceae bacterium]